MGYSPNSLKKAILGSIIGVVNGHTRSLDYSPYGYSDFYGLLIGNDEMEKDMEPAFEALGLRV